jgi:beta-lactamase superfamily II metal-dependent hydrolase
MNKKTKIISIILIVLIVLFVSGIVIRKNVLANIPNTNWTITQFGDNEGSQMMCFTIEGNNNGLVIVDGGYENNDDQYNFLMSKIKENNNTVDAWIITHFDSDHGGEFVRILSSSKINVKNIYVADTPDDMELLKENAPFEDDWGIYEKYLTMDLPQKIKVHSGDNYEFIGLKMKVLSSYDDWIDEQTNNLLNNGSIVFKLYGNEESMLFCGDIQNPEISNYLIENYKEELKSDYFQVPHHGNNTLGEEFYKLVSPKVSFFAAPDWLMENRDNVSWYTVEQNRAVLEELGSKILWHNTSPNEVILK